MMSKFTIIIDSDDDDDDVVEILECEPKPIPPVNNVSNANNTKKSASKTAPKPAPKPQTSSSSKAPSSKTTPSPIPKASSSKTAPSSTSKALPSKKPSTPSAKSKAAPKSAPRQPAKPTQPAKPAAQPVKSAAQPPKPTASSSRPQPPKPTASSSRAAAPPPPPPPASPHRAKAHATPTPKPKTPVPASPKRPTTTTTPKTHHISSPNPIPTPVVIYTSETREPSTNPVPLNSINKLFQRDARTVTLSKAASRRASSSLSRSPSSVDISKKFETDKELAAIFASNNSSPEPSPSTSAPSLTSTSTSSQPIRSSSPPPAATMDIKRPVFSSSPPRQMYGSSSQERRQSSSLFSPNSLNSPPAPTRKRPISSPQSPHLFSRPAFSKKKVIYGIDDEDGEEEDLELYINHVSSRRKLFSDEIKEAERRQMGNKQCPLCHMMFPKQEIMDHSFECDGKPTDKGAKKRTIGTAVALNAAERKRKNAGILDTGPTNYYADSDGALALDGSGFGSEVTGPSWESAGQTRFA